MLLLFQAGVGRSQSAIPGQESKAPFVFYSDTDSVQAIRLIAMLIITSIKRSTFTVSGLVCFSFFRIGIFILCVSIATASPERTVLNSRLTPRARVHPAFGLQIGRSCRDASLPHLLIVAFDLSTMK